MKQKKTDSQLIVVVLYLGLHYQFKLQSGGTSRLIAILFNNIIHHSRNVTLVRDISITL